MSRGLEVLAVGLFLVLAVMVYLPVAWASSESGGDHCDQAFLGGDERTSPDVQSRGWNWWPPGMRCQVTPQGGQARIEIAPLF